MSNVDLQVDRVVNTIATINQNYMSPDDDVTVAARGTAQTAYHVIWRRATHSPHIIIEHVARLKPTLVIVIPLVGLFKHRVVLVLVVIRLRGLRCLSLNLRYVFSFCPRFSSLPRFWPFCATAAQHAKASSAVTPHLPTIVSS